MKVAIIFTVVSMVVALRCYLGLKSDLRALDAGIEEKKLPMKYLWVFALWSWDADKFFYGRKLS